MAKGDRKRLQSRVTDQAREGLYAIASREHVTLTALLEAMGLTHHDVTIPPHIVEHAKRIDRERFSRR